MGTAGTQYDVPATPVFKGIRPPGPAFFFAGGKHLREVNHESGRGYCVGGQVQAVVPEHKSLEDRFLELLGEA